MLYKTYDFWTVMLSMIPSPSLSISFKMALKLGTASFDNCCPLAGFYTRRVSLHQVHQNSSKEPVCLPSGLQVTYQQGHCCSQMWLSIALRRWGPDSRQVQFYRHHTCCGIPSRDHRMNSNANYQLERHITDITLEIIGTCSSETNCEAGSNPAYALSPNSDAFLEEKYSDCGRRLW